MDRIVLAMGCAALIALPAIAADDSRDGRALAESVVRAYGGRAALAGVRSYRMEGRVFSAMRHEDASVIRVFQRPGRFKSLVEYDDGAEARVVDGDAVWHNAPGGPLEPADEPMRQAAILQAARAGLPWILAAHAGSARLLPDEPSPVPVKPPSDGVEVELRALEVPLGGGLLLRAWIDRAGLVRVSQGIMTRGAMATHFETLYEDFTTVSGVTFAFHERTWAAGTETGETTVRRVIVNPELRPDEFRPPAAADSAGTGSAGS